MRRLVFFLLLASLAAFAYLKLRHLPIGFGDHPEKFTPAAGPRLSASDLPSLSAIDAEYTKLVQSVVPSVVSVATSRRVRVPLVDSFDYLFGWRGRVTERTDSSLGSGVIVSQEGHILTNHHVVKDMQEIQVQLTDGRTLPATLIGSDESVDIAVLSIKAPNLVPLPLGDSDQVRVGQQVVAVGNPFGLQETVTRGIVSAKGRSLRDSGVEFFQTDAAVNPGNSGGPLLNIHGEIIGINSAIYSQTGAWAGISFAIPSNVARLTLENILKKGRPVRGYLGVNTMTLNRNLADQHHVKDLHGALVTEVVPGSPAERAGVKPGDVLRSFNQQAIASPATLRDLIAKSEIGSKVTLGILRDGQETSVTTEITEVPLVAGAQPSIRPALPAPSQPNQPSAPLRAHANVLAGLTVNAIPPNLRDSLPQDISGVIVSEIQPGTPAAEKLRVGDVIEEINKSPVPTVRDFDAVAQEIGPGDRALLFVCRGRSRAFVVLSP
jgi:serine protease Do